MMDETQLVERAAVLLHDELERVGLRPHIEAMPTVVVVRLTASQTAELVLILSRSRE